MLQLEPTRHRDVLSNLPIYDLLLRILHDAEHTLQHIAFDQSYPSFRLVEAGKQMETHRPEAVNLLLSHPQSVLIIRIMVRIHVKEGTVVCGDPRSAPGLL